MSLADSARQKYPGRLDVGRLASRSPGRTAGPHDRFAVASAATLSAPVVGSIAYRIFPLLGSALTPAPDKLWRKLRPRRAPLHVEPADPLWGDVAGGIEAAWQSDGKKV